MIALAAAITLVQSAGAAPAAAAPLGPQAAPRPASPPAVPAGPDLAKLRPSITDSDVWLGFAPADEKMAAYVVLDGPTALDIYRAGGHAVGDEAPAAVRARDEAFAALEAQHEPAREAIKAIGAAIDGEMDAVTNGFVVRATRRQLIALSGLPGLAYIERTPIYYPLLDKAVPTIGADRVFNQMGIGGKGVQVAIIDTGIDYTHRNLGGKGIASDYRNNDPSFIEAGSFPNSKVIGGWDFVGNYSGGVPAPDPDPLDQNLHGSHVGGIVAGLTGNPRVPHGVAPDASLIALKVFGPSGGTDVIVPAVEWCVEANLGRRPSGIPQRCDVINMSLGANWSYDVATEQSVIRRAAEAGVAVISASGNAGDIAFITSAPGATPFGLAVASTFAGGTRVDKIVADVGGRTEDIEALEADPTFAPQMAEVGSLTGDLAYLGRGCTGDASASDVNGKIALIAYGGCTTNEVIGRAKTEGATGAVLFNNIDQLFSPNSDTGKFGDRVEIPAFGIALPDGARLRDALAKGTAVKVTFAETYKNSVQKDTLADTISDFSSRGPSRDGTFKPEIAAPGSNITAPRIGTGDGPLTISGTSMATPMVCGVAALVIERLRKDGLAPQGKPLDPALSPVGLGALDVLAMLMNYTETVYQGDNRLKNPVALARSGSGRVNALRAVRGGTILRAGTIASVNYGRKQFDSTRELDPVAVKIINVTEQPKRYKISTPYLFADDDDGAITYSYVSSELDRNMITVPARSSKVVTLRTTVDPSKLKKYGAYGGNNVMSRGLTDAEHDAHVTATEIDAAGNAVPDGDVAHVPVYFVPRPVSGIHTTDPEKILVDKTTGVGPLNLVNDSPVPGKAEIFAHWATDEKDTTGPGMNMENVGIRIVRDPQNQRIVEFAIQTARRRDIPLETSFRVFLDTNRDGKMDKMLFNDDQAWFLSQLGIQVQGLRVDGSQRMLLMDVASHSPLGFRFPLTNFDSKPLAAFAEVTLDTRLIILRAYASDLGFGDAAPVAFNAVIWHHASFDDAKGSTAYDPYDAIPNNGFVEGRDGSAAILDGRLTFEEKDLGFTVDRWSVDVGRSSEGFATVTRKTGGKLDKVMIVYTHNLPGVDDVQIVRLEEGSVAPPPTLTPSATPTVGPTATPFRINTPVPTARPTPHGGDGVGRAFLPALLANNPLGGTP
ncbi:MAG: S8 family serine peptidase [Anaerolineae bacterium]